MRSRNWVFAPVAIAIVSRLFSAILLASYPRGPSPLLINNPGPFVAWDGQWYLSIAQFGYHANAIQAADLVGGHHDFAFYPGWPLLIKVASLGGVLSADLISVLLANVLFVLAAVAVYALFRDRFSERTALWGTLLLAFNPASYVFSMAYTESLFVLLVGLYFLNRYGRAAPVLAALSMLVRVAGLALGASAAVMFALNRAPRIRLVQVGVVIGLVFGAWWVYLWRLTGRLDGWFLGSASWAPYEGIRAIQRELVTHPSRELVWGAFVVLMIVGCLLMLRRHLDMAVYGLVAIALSLAAAPAGSMARHAMVAFPAFGMIADKLGPRLSALLVIAFAVAQIGFVKFAFGVVSQPP